MKAGRVTVSHVQDLVGVIHREEVQTGVFLSLNAPSRPMRQEAASAGLYKSALGEHPRIQLLTIEDVLESGKTVAYPPRLHIVPRAASARKGSFSRATHRGGTREGVGDNQSAPRPSYLVHTG